MLLSINTKPVIIIPQFPQYTLCSFLPYFFAQNGLIFATVVYVLLRNVIQQNPLRRKRGCRNIVTGLVRYARYVVDFHQAGQMLAGYAKSLGCAGYVASHFGKGSSYQFPFFYLTRFLQVMGGMGNRREEALVKEVPADVPGVGQ